MTIKTPRPHSMGFVFLFCACLLLLWPWLAWIGLLPMKIATFENRRFASFPTQMATLEDWVQWPRRIDTYLDDNLPNRGALMRLNAWIKYRVLHTSPVGSILVGKEGWLFYHTPDDMREFEGHLQRKPYQLRRLRVILEERRDWLAERGIDYMVFITPTKQTVYPEKMPDWMKPAGAGFSRRELLESELQRAGSKLEWFDFALVLREAKEQWGDTLFYRHDSHWNYRGAVLGYAALARRYPKWFRAPGADWVDTPTLRESNLMHMMGLPGHEVTPYPQPPGGMMAKTLKPDTDTLKQMEKRGAVAVYHRSDVHAPRLYLMGDSFAGWNTAYLAENFSRTVMTNTWGDQWQRYEQFPITNIQAEHPNLVIDQMLENRLDLGVSRALLGDTRGDNHPPEVRTARLRRLFGSGDNWNAGFIMVDNEIEIIRTPSALAEAYIVRLELESENKAIIESVSPYPEGDAWKDRCRRAGELTQRAVGSGRTEVLLCVSSTQDAKSIRLRLASGSVRVLKARIALHPDA